jgi:DNA replication protein DnaC
LAKADGTYARLLSRFARTDVLVIDDWIFASQLDSKRYHDYLGDPTIADAVCDRLLHNAHRVVLQGPSRRKEDAPIK